MRIESIHDNITVQYNPHAGTPNVFGRSKDKQQFKTSSTPPASKTQKVDPSPPPTDHQNPSPFVYTPPSVPGASPQPQPSVDTPLFPVGVLKTHRNIQPQDIPQPASAESQQTKLSADTPLFPVAALKTHRDNALKHKEQARQQYSRRHQGNH